MASKKYVSLLRYLTPLWLVLAACSENAAPKSSWAGVCIDADGDGHGLQCSQGDDCDDADPAVHSGCAACAKPAEGCSCSEGSKPQACSLAPELTSSGSLICKDGTRYCRDGAWTACEGIRSYEAPTPSELGLKVQGLVQADASVACGPCAPDCFDVKDDLAVYDAGADASLVSQVGGGITLHFNPGTGGDGGADAGLLDDPKLTCIPGTAPDSDCDGVPDDYDTSPDGPPFVTDHNTIFMDLGPGQASNTSFDSTFKIRTADIYFYIDMTRSMEEERDALIASLISGNYLPSAGVGIDCADRDFNGSPDNYLKESGVAGNIFCLIRDSALGAGWFRDIPFKGPFDATNNVYVAPSTFEMYENRQDITDNIQSLLTALQGFQTGGNYNHPEGSMQGLWSIATGGEIYAGWDRPGIPARTDCPTARWGYPCFRDGAVPIVIHITDASMQNGPPTSTGRLKTGSTTQLVNYNAAVLTGLRPGTGATYRALTTTAESFADAQDVGTVDSAFVTYAGNTEKMRSDLSYFATGTCSGNAWDATLQDAGDAVFKFHLNSTKTITISSRGSHFDSSLLLLRGPSPTTTTLYASNNGVTASAFDLGILPAGRKTLVNGTLVGNGQVFAREGMEVSTAGGCFNGQSATDRAEAGVFKFRVAANANVRVSTTPTVASTPMTSVLYGVAPTPPDTIDMTGIGVDTVGTYNVGSLNGAHVHLTGLSTVGAASNIVGTTSSDLVGCSSTGTSADEFIDFSLAAPATVRIETSGDGSALAAGASGTFNHGVAIMQRAAAPLPTVKTVSGNGTLATAALITEADINAVTAGTWVKYTGNSWTDTPTYEQADVGGSAANRCGAGYTGGNTADKDVVFKFVVTSTQTYEFETSPNVVGTGYQTWLSLHKDYIDTSTTLNVSNAAELDTATGQSLTSSIDYQSIVALNGQIDQRNRSYSPSITGSDCGSTSNSSSGGRDAVFKFRATTSGKVDIRTVGPTGTGVPAFDSYLAVYKTSITSGNRVSPNCPSPWGQLFGGPPPNQSGNGWATTVDVVAGTDYYVLVKEWTYSTSLNATSGKFGLIVADQRAATAFIECNVGAGSTSTASKISRTLTAGTYYLVIKGTGPSSLNSAFSLNVRKPSTGGATALACVNHTSYRAIIERTLPAGEYSAMIKGRSSATGTYNLTMRDVSVAPVPLACGNTAKGTTTFTANGLTAGTDYYLVTRGNSAAGSYTLNIEDTSTTTPTPLGCDNDGAPGYSVVSGYDSSIEVDDDAQIQQSLTAGDYYVVLKGRTSSNNGWFQVSIGNNTGFATTSFAPKTWSGVGGVREALIDKGIRVITVNSTQSDTTLQAYLTEQATTLSKDTGAVYTNGDAIALPIASNGTGLGTAVIDAVSALVGTLSMDLGLRLVGNPGFLFQVEAIQKATNGCTRVEDRDGDALHLPDVHIGCKPGTIPRFKLTFTNPLPGVPNNPSDPNNGYDMKIQLLDVTKKFVVDEIPVYIIPQQVTTTPAAFAPSGVYEQTIDANRCSGTQVPRWESLSWSATLPSDSKVTWKVCSGADDAEAASCTLKLAGAVYKSASTEVGGTCTQGASYAWQCPNGYCTASNVCHQVKGPACSAASECGDGGLCVNSVCMWTQNPIDLTPALVGGSQGKRKMRVQATLDASTDRTAAPTISSWNLQYTCVNQL